MIRISLNTTHDDESIVEHFEINMTKGQYSIPFYYSTHNDTMII